MNKYRPVDRSLINSNLSYKYNKIEDIDNTITSVYLDNSDLFSYLKRLYKLPKSEAIRIRYYTEKDPEFVFIERKMHEDSWTGGVSKKMRFKISEGSVNNYLRGEDVYEEVFKLNGDVYNLYKEIQDTITLNNLRPALRTVYRRTAFQLPNCNKIRLSLDTHLCMIRECSNFELKNKIKFKNWRRNDVTKFPYAEMGASEIVKFPHGILEVKTHSLDGVEPFWVTNLRNSELVEHVHKFSKFMHGMASLFTFIEKIPYWLPQMEKNINIIKSSDILESEGTTMSSYLEENKKSNNARYKNYNREKFNREKSRNINEVSSINESNTNNSSNTINSSNTNNDSNSGNGNISSIMLNMKDKIVAIPCKVEPKVFFANERTFLSWLNFSIFLGGIGTALMGLGRDASRISGLAFVFVSVLFSFYALYIFIWRGRKIRERDPGPYDDTFGPIVLVVAFLLALLVALVFKFPLKVRY